jgi:hypothetical protein
MTNMSYCRFQNTLKDLKDCFDNMDDDLEGGEEKARVKLIELCQQIVDDYGGVEVGDE